MTRFACIGLVLFAAACGDDGGKAAPDAAKAIDAAKQIDSPPIVVDAAPDAPPTYDFSCEGMARPTPGVTPISLGGTITEIMVGFGTSGITITQAPVEGMRVDLYANTSPQGESLANSTSTATGTWSMANVTNTGAQPFDVYAVGAKDSYRTTLVFPPFPFVASSAAIPVLTFSDSTWTLINSQVHQDDTTNGLIAVQVTDCAGTAVDDATLNVYQADPATSVGTIASLGAGMDTMGAQFVANVPPGTTHMTATYLTHTWRIHDVLVVKGEDTTTTMIP
jgi:hypothetical protein